MATDPSGDDPATTAEMLSAAGVRDAETLHRWANLGLLPRAKIHYLGRGRGKRVDWPRWAVDQARWIREQIEQQRRTLDEIKTALDRGDYPGRKG